MRARQPASELAGMSLPWPARSVIAGAAGTTITLAYAAERRLRAKRRSPADYDNSLVPGQIVASVMHLARITDREDHELGVAVRPPPWPHELPTPDPPRTRWRLNRFSAVSRNEVDVNAPILSSR
jgi:hypothetical protein